MASPKQQTSATVTEINIDENGGPIEVAVISGFAQITVFGLTRLPGEAGNVVEEGDGKAGRLYRVASPDDLNGEANLVCHGRVFKTAGESFSVTCTFQQDGKHIGTAEPVAGRFNKETVAFRLICRFK